MGRSCSRPQIHQFSPSWASLPHETLRNLPAWVQEANLRAAVFGAGPALWKTGRWFHRSYLLLVSMHLYNIK